MEHSYVDIVGKAHEHQLSICEDAAIEHNARLIAEMKKVNPKLKVCCQLAHAGKVAINSTILDINTATTAEIDATAKKFVEAAVRAEKAGYDCVQLHSGHDYFLSQTISDYYNTRTDEYRAADFKVLRETLAACKAAVHIPVGVKLQCDDFIEGHTMNPEQAANILSALDFDFVEITGGGQEKAKYSTIRKGNDVYYYKHVVSLFRERNLLKK